MNKYDILTLFPEVINGALDSGILKQAMENNLFEVKCTQIRDFSNDKHKKTDDYSFGGGAGMSKIVPSKSTLFETSVPMP